MAAACPPRSLPAKSQLLRPRQMATVLILHEGIRGDLWEMYLGHAPSDGTSRHYIARLNSASLGEGEALEKQMTLLRTHVTDVVGWTVEGRRQATILNLFEREPSYLLTSSERCWAKSSVFSGTPEGIRTPNLLVRSQALYPIELRAHTRSSRPRRRDSSPTPGAQKKQLPFILRTGVLVKGKSCAECAEIMRRVRRDRGNNFVALPSSAGHGADGSTAHHPQAGQSVMYDLPELNRQDQVWLLQLARRTLENLEPSGSKTPKEKVLTGEEPVPESACKPRGAFVTLHKGAALRGCIGYVMPTAPLYRAVIENAVNAARRDPRFPPVTLDEAPDLRIEISVMTLPRPIQSVEEIEVGRHGLIVTQGAWRGLLLPQVATEYGWDRETFLDHTCQKAGLPAEAWRKGKVEIEVFSAQVFSESG